MKSALLLFVMLAAAGPAASPNVYPAAEPAGNAGFVPIFDGKTLNGWEGDKIHWRVEDGCIVGEITAATTIQVNTFLIWRGGTPRDFELKVEYRISAQGNSGINYRSAEIPGREFGVKGYQFDLDGENRNRNNVATATSNYEEARPIFLALRSQITRVVPGYPTVPPQIIGSLGDDKELQSVIKNGDWNQIHIIARGNVLTHILNGRVMSVVIDEDPVGRRLDGIIGVQVHQGPPMKIEFRNFLLKDLPPIPPPPGPTNPITPIIISKPADQTKALQLAKLFAVLW